MLNHNQFSYWERKSFVSNIDFVVIGAGIVGYSTALHLKKRFPGCKVVILERGYLPTGASSKNAGFACFGSPTEIWDDLRHTPKEQVWTTVEKRFRGLQYLSELLGAKNIDLQNHGSWDLIQSKDDEIFELCSDILPELNRELKTITGVADVYSIDNEVSQKFGFRGFESSFYNKLEAQLDTAALNRQFYKLIVDAEIPVLFDHEVSSIESSDTACFIETNHGELRAKACFVCTNGFARTLLPESDVDPARAQVLITQPIPDLQIKGTFHIEMGYFYFRNIDGRILFGGGRNLDFTGEKTDVIANTERITQHLEGMLRTQILPNHDFQIEHKWAGIMGVGSEKAPIIKEVSPNVYCGVRLGGMGVAIGSLVGKELSEMI